MTRNKIEGLYSYPTGQLVHLTETSRTASYPSLTIRISQEIGRSHAYTFSGRWVSNAVKEGTGEYETIKTARPVVIKVFSKSLEEEYTQAIKAYRILFHAGLIGCYYYGYHGPEQITLEVGAEQEIPIKIKGQKNPLTTGTMFKADHHMLIMDQHLPCPDLLNTMSLRTWAKYMSSSIRSVLALHSRSHHHEDINPHCMLLASSYNAETGVLEPMDSVVFVNWGCGRSGDVNRVQATGDSDHLPITALFTWARNAVKAAVNHSSCKAKGVWTAEELERYNTGTVLGMGGLRWGVDEEINALGMTWLHLLLESKADKSFYKGWPIRTNNLEFLKISGTYTKPKLFHERTMSIWDGQYRSLLVDRDWMLALVNDLEPFKELFQAMIYQVQLKQSYVDAMATGGFKHFGIESRGPPNDLLLILERIIAIASDAVKPPVPDAVTTRRSTRSAISRGDPVSSKSCKTTTTVLPAPEAKGGPSSLPNPAVFIANVSGKNKRVTVADGNAEFSWSTEAEVTYYANRNVSLVRVDGGQKVKEIWCSREIETLADGTRTVSIEQPPTFLGSPRGTSRYFICGVFGCCERRATTKPMFFQEKLNFENHLKHCHPDGPIKLVIRFPKEESKKVEKEEWRWL